MELTDEEKQAVAEAEAKRLAEEKAENDRLMKEKDDALAKAEQDKAKLEGMMEAFRAMQSQPQAAKEWTAEQWAEFEEKTKMSKDQFITVGGIVRAQLDTTNKEIDARLKASEDRVKAAEARAEQAEKQRVEDATTKEFLAKKPEFARYEKDIKDFLNDYPETDRSNPEKLKKLLEKAETYVKGKVGEKAMRQDNTQGSARFGGTGTGAGDAGGDEDDKLDTTGLPEYEKATLGRLATRTKEEKETYKKHFDPSKGGVVLSMEADFNAVKK